MKILYVLNSANPGGMEQHVLDLVTGMVSQGHDVFVWCVPGPLVTQYTQAGASVTHAHINFDIDPKYIYSLTKFLKKNNIDVLHAHELRAVVNSLVAGYLAKTPVRISHTHTPISEWKIGNLKKKLNIFVNSLVVNNLATKEIALTESRRAVKILEGINKDKLVIIPNGICVAALDFSPKKRTDFRAEIISRFNIPNNTFIFGNISRLSKEKGHGVLLHAFAEFLQKCVTKNLDSTNIFLIIAGGGILEKDLKKLADDLGISANVCFTGRFADSDQVKFYAAFDAFVFPTLAEGFGIVLIEAMASGVPVICSDLPVLQEVGGATVLYFEVGDSASLAQKMLDLYARYDKFADLCHGAKERVAQLYSMEKFVSKYEALYLSLLEDV